MGEAEKQRRCTLCGLEQPVSAFHKSSRSKDGLLTRCKACTNAYNRSQYRKHYVPSARNQYTGTRNARYSHGLRSRAPGLAVKVGEKVTLVELGGLAQQVGDQAFKMAQALAEEVGGYFGHEGNEFVDQLAEAAQKAHMIALKLTGTSAWPKPQDGPLAEAAYARTVAMQAGELQLVLSQCASGWAYFDAKRRAGKRVIDLDPTLRITKLMVARVNRAVRMIERLASVVYWQVWSKVGW